MKKLESRVIRVRGGDGFARPSGGRWAAIEVCRVRRVERRGNRAPRRKRSTREPHFPARVLVALATDL